MNEQGLDLERFANPEENKEKESAERAFGLAYTGMIDYFLGNNDNFDEEFSSLEDKHKKLLLPIFELANNKIAEQKVSHEILLDQIKTRFPLLDDNDIQTFRIIEKKPGFFMINMPFDVMNKLSPGARGLAYCPEKGVSTVLVPRYENEALNPRSDAENIPHESHHVLWRWGLRAGIVGETLEETELRQQGFIMYQDEFLARLSSNGGFFGYTHLQFVSIEKRREMFKTDSNVSKMMSEVGEINEIWRDARMILDASNVLPTDLIAPIWQAKTFGDIKTIAENTLSSLRGF